jgi:hypothetical protein
MSIRRLPILIFASMMALPSCSFLGQGTSRVMEQLSGRDIVALDGATKGHPAARVCGLSTSDGAVRMSARGDIAIVDIKGKPQLLSLTYSSSAGATYRNDTVEIAISFVADLLADNGTIIGHKADVVVTSPSVGEHFQGIWDC